MTEAKNKDTSNDKTEDKKEETGKKTLSLGGTLSLKGGTAPKAPPTSGRSGIAVEVRRSKRAAPQQQSQQADAPGTSGSDELATLTNAERQARIEALQKSMEEGERKSSLPKRQDTTIVKKEEKEEAPSKDDLRKKELEELQRIEEEERAKAEAAKASAPPIHNRKERTFNNDSADTTSESYRDRLKKAEAKAPPKPRPADDRRRSRITVTQAINNDFERDRGPSLAAQKRAREKARMAAKNGPMETKKIIREVILPEAITVQELANRMAEPGGDVVKALMKLGVMATINQTIDADTAELIIDEFGHKVKRVTEADIEIGMEGEEDKPEDLISRPPVVTIMGHVDHGKTSLLDALRSTDVAAGEAGGITQHIGAYQVTMNSGDKITFLDTPGHAAFTEMRARGANVTDIVVIVVAADDSIMPQTIEAINHAKAAEVPIIIAINKIDKPEANPQKIKTDLLQYEVVVEEMSGDVQCVEISAKQQKNLDKLEEAILIQAEILELKANPDRPAQGYVVESKLERGRGSVATALIQNGTLKIGDVFVAGSEMGKVKALINDRGKNIEAAIPGMPVEVIGLNASPQAGDSLIVVGDESRAREISEYRQRKKREAIAAKNVKNRTTIEDLVLQREIGEVTKLPVIIKADVHGSVEAIAGSLAKMVEETPDIDVHVIHSGVGGIIESDVTLAKASGALIIGFNVRAGAQARDMATRDDVDIRYYNVIYDVIDDAKSILSGMLSPTIREEYIGQAKILQVFNISKVGKIAGCMVEEGAVRRGNKVRLLRDNVVIHEGMLKTLKRFKDEVKEVKEGTECGMAFENYEDLRVDDVIECYEVIEEARTVD
ncbi:MAG: translation initiation factor IF-2 [Micavibrio sp.]|nr:translation initiation factor IF-2 [Micavibrio sp.]